MDSSRFWNPSCVSSSWNEHMLEYPIPEKWWVHTWFLHFICAVIASALARKVIPQQGCFHVPVPIYWLVWLSEYESNWRIVLWCPILWALWDPVRMKYWLQIIIWFCNLAITCLNICFTTLMIWCAGELVFLCICWWICAGMYVIVFHFFLFCFCMNACCILLNFAIFLERVCLFAKCYPVLEGKWLSIWFGSICV